MSLLLNGSRTMTIAGTPIQCLEIYTGESYTLPFSFLDNTGNAIDCTGWTLSTAAKFYTVDTVAYPDENTVTIGNLTLDSPQPTTGANTYTANLTAAFTTANTGVGYMYIPTNLSGGTGSPNPTPTLTLANTTANSVLVIVTLGVQRTDALSSLVDYNREPIGFIVRFQ
jgi:hypothetical protein